MEGKRTKGVINTLKEKSLRLGKLALAFLMVFASLNLSSIFGTESLTSGVEAAGNPHTDFWGDTEFSEYIDWDNIPGSVSYLEPIGDFDAESVGQRSVVKMTQLANGYLAGAALDANGAVWTWGWNGYGALGIGKTEAQQSYFGGMRRTPYFVDNGIFITQIQGNYHNRMALSDKGEVYTWGHGAYGEMGNGTTTSANTLPQKVPGLPKIKEILSSAGEIMGTNYAIDESGQIWGWGYNVNGQLGNGTTATAQKTPVKINVPAGTSFVKLSAGDHQLHAIDQNGDIWNAGYQYQGRLGNGKTTGNNTTLTKMSKPSGMSKIIDISSNFGITIALDDKNVVWQWGPVYGLAASTGTPTTKSIPEVVHVDPSEIATVKYTPVAQNVYAGESISYFVDQHGRSWAWGSNRYFGLGREGGYETANDIQLQKAQQWPKVIGDGDTQIYDTSKKTPFAGASKLSKGGYSFNQLHPTIYDDKYKDNPKDDVWKTLAFKNIPYISQIIGSRSAYTILDEAGNIYKWGNDGSGSIAWGWDYDTRYDLNGSLSNGLYDRYTYEVMFMRGMPTIDPMYSTIDKTTKKIYVDDTNPQKDDINVSVKMPAIYSDSSLNLTFTPELRSIKYVKLPYDTSNDDFNAATMSSERFEELYNSGAFKTGELVDTPILSQATATTIKKQLEVTENGKILVMVESFAYSATTKTVDMYTADNFYTPVNLKHEGNGYVDGKVYENIYTPTADNIVKVKEAGDTSDVIGMPLDAKGDVIVAPTFGYDKATISKYDTLPNGEDKYWLFSTPQDAKKSLTLNNKKYLGSDNVHEFKYERNPSGWITISYEGKDVDTNTALPQFDITPNPEIVKIDKELVRTPTVIPNYENLGYNVNTDTDIYDLDSKGDFVFTPTKDSHITFLYGTWNSVGNKGVQDANNDGFAAPKETLSYTITYKNEGSGSYNNLFVKDDLANILPHITDPSNDTVTINNDGVISTKKVSELINGFTIDKVAGKKKVTITFNVSVIKDLDLDAVKEFVNVVTLGDTTATITIPTGKADLKTVKEVFDANNDGLASAGEELTYKITSTNKGPATATDFILQDELTDVLLHVDPALNNDVTVYVDGVKTVYTVDQLTKGITIPELKKDQVLTATFKVKVKADLDAEVVKKIANKVTVGDTDEEVIIETGEPDLDSKKGVVDATGDGVASPGEKLTYTLYSLNKGPATASDFILRDELKTVLPHVADPKANKVTVDIDGVKTIYTVQNLIDGITIPELKKDQVLTATFEVIVKSDLDVNTVDKIANKATIGKTTPETSIPTGKVELLSDKDVDDANDDGFASPGEVLSYTITATNNGNAVSDNITIKDLLTNVLGNIKETSATIAVNVSSNTDVSRNETKTADDLIAGLVYKLGKKETITVTFDVTVKDDLDVNLVKAIANNAVVGEQTPSISIPTGEVDIDPTKTVTDANNDTFASPGEELTYTITAINNGVVTAENYILKDPLTKVLPHVLDPKANTVTLNIAGVVSTRTVQELIDGITIPELKKDQIVTATFKVTVDPKLDPSAVANLENIATVGDKPTPPVVVPVGDASLTSHKGVVDATGDGIAAPGEQLTYTIRTSNGGPATASNFIVKDELKTVLPHVVDPKANKVTVDIDGVKTVYTVQNLIDGITIPELKKDQILTVTFDVVVRIDLNTTSVDKIANKATVGKTTPEVSIPTGKTDLLPLKSVKDANNDTFASPGEELTYTISSTNGGLVTAKNFVVKDPLTNVLPHVNDPLEDNVTLNVAGVESTHKVKDLIAGITIPELKKDETVTVTFKVTVKSDLDTSTIKELKNIATVGDKPTPPVIIPVEEADLDSKKTVEDADNDKIASPGEVLSYKITSTNKGPATASNFIVRDELKTVLPHVDNALANDVTVDIDGAKTTYKVQDLIDGITIPELKKNQTVTVTFDVTVRSDLDVEVVKEIANTATVGKTTPPIVIPTGKPDVTPVKSVTDANNDTFASPGEELTYVITAKNNGDVTAKNLILKDPLTKVLPYVVDPKANTVTLNVAGTITTHTVKNLIDGITIPELKKNQTITATFKVIVDPKLDASTITNLENIATLGDIPTPPVVIPVEDAALDSNKGVVDATGDGIASPGEKLTYTIYTKNNGPANASNFIVKDELKTVLPHVNNALANDATVDIDGAKTTYKVQDLIDGITIPELKKDQEMTVTFDVVVKSDLDTTSVDKIANKATVGKTTPEVIIPTGKTDLVSSKTVADATNDKIASPGEVLSYKITAKNSGTATADAITIKDTLTNVLGNIKETSATIVVNVSSDKDASKNAVKTADDLIAGMTYKLVAGETVTVTFDVTVKDDLDTNVVKAIANNATVGTQTPNVTIPTGKTDVAPVKSVTDANNDTFASPGEELTYVITAKNNGDVTAKNLILKDPLTKVLPYVVDPKANTVTLNVAGTITTHTVKNLIDGITIPELKKNQTITATFKVTVDPKLDASTITNLENIATLGDIPTPPVVIPVEDAAFDSNKGVVDATGDGIASPGEKLTYTIYTKNNGPANASNFIVKDELKTVLPHVNNALANDVTVDIDGAKTTYKVQDLIDGITIPELKKDQEMTVTFDVVVKSDLDTTSVDKIANKATVGKTTPEVIIPTGKTDLVSSKTVADATNDKIASPGEVLSYKITAKNSGTATADAITIKDTLTNVLGNIKETSATIVVNVSSDKDASKNAVKTADDLIAGMTYKLVAGETVTVTFDVTVKDDLDTNVVKAIANNATVGTQTPNVTIPTGKTDVAPVKSVTDANNDTFASPGEELTYVITAKNNGDVTAKNLILKDPLTKVLPYVVDPKANTVTLNVAGTITTHTVKNLIDGITIPELKKNQTITATFKVTVDPKLDASTITNLENIATLGDIPTPPVVIPVEDAAFDSNKGVVDATGDGIASPGEKLTYTIYTKNNGPANASNFIVKDELKTVLPHVNNALANDVTVDIDGAKTTYKVQDLIDGITIPELKKDQEMTVTFDVVVKSDLDTTSVDKIANKATVGKTTPEVIIPTGKTDLVSSKTVADATNDKIASPGEVLSYKITAKNSGTATADAITIKDTLTNVLGNIKETSATIVVNVSSDKDASKNAVKTADDLIAGMTYKLVAGETVTVTFDVTVKDDLDTNVVKAIANNATVGTQTPNVTIPTGKTDVAPVKSVTDANNDTFASPGEELTYVITAKNNGDVTAKNLILKDPLTKVLPYVVDPKANTVTLNVAGTITTHTVKNLIDGITIPELKKNQTITATFKVTVDPKLDASTITNLENIATLGDIPTPPVVIPVEDAAFDSNKGVVDATGDGIASPGEKLTYTIYTKNNGPANASNFIVKDELKTVLPHVNNALANDVTVDIDGAKTTYKVQDLIDGITIPELKKDQEMTVTFDVVVKSDLDTTSVDKIANKATVGKTTPEVIIPTGKTDLVSSKTVADATNDKIASPGEVLSYKITAKNSGTATADAITIKDTLTNVLGNIKETSATIVVNVSSDKDASKNAVKTADDLIAGMTYKLVAGETVTVTFDVTVKDDLDTNVVKAIANNATVGTQTPNVTIPTGKTDVAPVKSVTDANNDTFASPGEELTYVITAKNNGDVTAKNLILKDPLTKVLPYVVDPKANTVTLNVAGTITTHTVKNLIDGITIPELKKNQTITATFKVTVDPKLDASTITNLENIATLGDIPTPPVVIPVGKTDLIPNKTVADASGDGIASPNEVLKYTITAKNDGNAESNAITIKDELKNVLANIKETSATIVVNVSSDKDAAKTAVKTGDELIAGLSYKLASKETVTVTFDVTVKGDLNTVTTTSIANQATIGDKLVSATIGTGKATILANKAVADANNDGIASPGEVLTYKISANNTGNTESDSITMKDSLTYVLNSIKEDAASIEVAVASNKDASKNAKFTANELIAGFNYKLVAGEIVDITFDVTVKDDIDVVAVPTIMNKATVGDKSPEITISTGKSEITPSKTVVDESGDKIASPGEKLTYTLTAKNKGSVVANAVTIKDTLDGVKEHIKEIPGDVVVNVTSDKDAGKNTTVSADQLITGLTYNLVADELVSVTFTVTLKDDLNVDVVKKIKNIATISGAPNEVELPTGKVDLEGNKKVQDANNDGFASPEEELAYTITAKNKGSVEAKSVIIKDEMSSLLPSISKTPKNIVVQVKSDKVAAKNMTVSADQLIAGLAFDIASNETITVSFKVVLASDLDVDVIKEIANLATIAGVESKVVIPTGDAGMLSSKAVSDEDGDGFASPNEELSYTITAKNTGTVKSEQVKIQDLLTDVIPNIKELASDIVVNVSSDTDPSKDETISGADLIAGKFYDIESKETITIKFTVTTVADLNSDVTTMIANKAIVGETTPEVKIEVLKNTYRIFYDLNGYSGGEAPLDGTSYFKLDQVSIKGFMTRSQTTQTFVSWNTMPDGSGVSYQLGDVVTFEQLENLGLVAADRSVTLYAIWEAYIPPVIERPSTPVREQGPATGALFSQINFYIIGASLIGLLSWKKIKVKKSDRRNRRV